MEDVCFTVLLHCGLARSAVGAVQLCQQANPCREAPSDLSCPTVPAVGPTRERQLFRFSENRNEVTPCIVPYSSYTSYTCLLGRQSVGEAENKYRIIRKNVIWRFFF